MTNEIKEILDKAKEISDYGADGKQHTRMFNQFEAKALLDYITNLQEEKENAVECLKYYEEKHFIKPAIDNTKLTLDLYDAYMKDINDLQTRIDKAIEYCELNKEFTPRLVDIEEILKGEDK